MDQHSAHFVAAAIRRRLSLVIALPDASLHRSTLLFAYALLTLWWSGRKSQVGVPRNVLYCGSETGIREQLAKVSVNGLGPLTNVFDQFDLARGRSTVETAPKSELPSVTTAYSPTNPELLVSTVTPSIILVDFGDAAELPWFPELLRAGREKHIPIVAWGTNPLSSVIDALGPDINLVQWPFARTFEDTAVHANIEDAELLFHPYIVTEVEPFLVNSWECAHQYSQALRAAADALHNVWDTDRATFAQQAYQRFWRLYRTLENLHVPYSFHEAEVQQFWGLDSIERQFEVCRHFQHSLESGRSSAARQTGTALDAMREAQEYLTQNDPPLWQAVSELIRSEAPSGRARLFTLPTESRKALLDIALVAKLGLTADDLSPLRNWTISLGELQSFSGYTKACRKDDDVIPRTLTLVPHIIGVPTPGQLAKVWPTFLADDVVLIAHDFQISVANQRVSACNTRLSPNLDRLSQALLHLAPFPTGEDHLSTKPRIRLTEPRRILLSAQTKQNESTREAQITPAFHLEDEVGRLLQDQDDFDISDSSTAERSNFDVQPELLLSEAIDIRFSDGWEGQFAPHQMLNFVDREHARCDPRAARSLHVGDTVLIIPFQQRQSLYATLISRVHRHPAIEIHLSVLRRWREDLRSGYQRWSAPYRLQWLSERDILQKFLHELQLKGSAIQSAQAIQFWLDGLVLAPMYETDVLRVGQILQRQFLEQQYKRIGAAAARIRGLHRGLSNRLNNWLNERATGDDRAGDHDIIDSETGLTFGDIKNSLVVAKIISTRTMHGSFLPSMLGYIDKGHANG